jgi:hypothetical protein
MTLALDEGRPSEALAEWSEWSKLFGTSRRTDYQARAHSRLALALVSMNQLTEAAREVKEATRLVKDSEDVHALADVALADAKLRAATGDSRGSMSTLQGMLALAKLAGRPTEYETRLELGEVEKARRTPDWQEHLHSLAKSAEKEHFTLFANRAAALLE